MNPKTSAQVALALSAVGFLVPIVFIICLMGWVDGLLAILGILGFALACCSPMLFFAALTSWSNEG